MSSWVKCLVIWGIMLSVSFPVHGETDSPRLGIGTVATAKEISGWDIDIRPDGKGLPPGQGTAAEGEPLYGERCARCHGDFGEGAGNFPALVGGDQQDLKNTDRPVKTVGNFWPYSSTLFDYIRRAMPFGDAQSLTANETYALTAFILSENDIIADDTIINTKTLPGIEMPNADGFYSAPAHDTKNTACMQDCLDAPPVISSRARILVVTPDGLPAKKSGE